MLPGRYVQIWVCEYGYVGVVLYRLEYPYVQVQVFTYTSVHVGESGTKQVGNIAGMPVCKYASAFMQVFECVSMQVHNYAGM